MFWLYAFENALTIVGALALYPVIGARGLTAAWIGAYTVTLPIAWRRLRRSADVSLPFTWLAKTALGTLAMAAAVTAVLELVKAGTLLPSIGRIALAVAVGAGVFVALARWLGVEELHQLSGRWRSLRTME